MRPLPLNESLLQIFPKERIRTRLIDRIVYSSDAGFYRLVPEAIVLPTTEEEVAKLLKLAQQIQLPVTFRTGGTSLSGQAVTDGILVDLSQHWRKITPDNSGKTVRVQPGAIGAWVNLALKKYGAKIGPDPSSIASAMMGGILANNASGMCCGVKHNSYHTLKSIRFLLPSGNAFNTELKDDYTRFEREEANLFAKIKECRNRILSDEVLLNKIREKYRIKNTVGYSLNAFIDHEHPLDVLAHLLIGSEGTLAFIAEAVLNTLPDLPHKATALLLFDDISEACKAILPIKTSKAEAVELMDRASLKAIEHLEGMPSTLLNLSGKAAALLIEYQAETGEQLTELLKAAYSYLNQCQTITPFEFSFDVTHQAQLWKIRKGLFPAVGAIRNQGTTVILEDVAFPIECLADAVCDLQKLFKKYNYDNAIIFGHAKDGNLHFVVTQSFDQESETRRYARFIDEMVELVVKKYNGSLKAEHGTGRNMAPFVETEWGAEAYAIMKEIKETVDPLYILNPGVIISKDKEIHLKQLKTLPIVEEEVDKCIECGFCERLCPSRDITLTPRKRIVARRFMEDKTKPLSLRRQLRKQYQYDGLDTCAVDGLCATDCPVDINTGTLVKRLRKEGHSHFGNSIALFIAKHFSRIEALAKLGIQIGNIVNKTLGNNTLNVFTSAIKRWHVPFPLWMKGLSGPSKSIAYQAMKGDFKAIAYSTCIHRMMGDNKQQPSWIDTLINLSHKTDIQLFVHKNSGLCCGQAFSSKGYTEAAAFAANSSIEWLWNHTNQGEYPIVIDTTSCAHTFQQSAPLLSNKNQERLKKLLILDVTAFAAMYLLPRLTIKMKKKRVVLHPVCSLEKMKLKAKMIEIAKICAEEVIVPQHTGCCGMAGDRGFFFPELTKSATFLESSEIEGVACDGYYSTGKTCEMAMTEATGKEYISLLYLLDEVS